MTSIVLVKGMFGSEFRNTCHAFGLSCGQMRPSTHDCTTCGLNPIYGKRIQGPARLENDRGRMVEEYPRGWCRCNTFVPRCEKLTHNSSWFNQKGEKLGWGDLCVCDLLRISAECKEPFYILAEHDSYWDLARMIKEGKMPEGASLDAPGIEYVREHCMWVIAGKGAFGIYNIDRGYGDVKPGKGNSKSYGALTYLQIHRDDMKGLGL